MIRAHVRFGLQSGAMTAENCGGSRQWAPLRIGDWIFEPELDRISRGEEQRKLRPRVTELLLCLAQADGKLVSKRQLIDHVWRSEFVTENALTHLIAELRAALGDSSADPHFVETIPRRGYRLIAEVEKCTFASAPEIDETPRFALVDENGLELALAEGENLIGRTSEARVRIDASEVSRRHARILIHGGSASIEDLGSKNGTYLRGRRIRAPERLDHADEITIGLDLARFRFQALDPETRTEQPND